MPLRMLAELESGQHAFACLVHAAIGRAELLDSGSRVVAMDDLYGGSYRILERLRNAPPVDFVRRFPQRKSRSTIKPGRA